MANLILTKLLCLACLFYYANTGSISLNSERGLSFNFAKFRAPERDETLPSESLENPPSEKDGIDFLGDTAVSNNVVHLTNSRSSKFKYSHMSAGRIVYNETIQLSSIANFSTHFVFSLYPPKNENVGDGIAFFLEPEGTAYMVPNFAYGGWFGLTGDFPDKLPDLFAVAFDSIHNLVGTFNHNFSGLHYLKNTTFSALNNGTRWDAWIDYNSEIPELKVYLASGSHSLKSHQNLILSQRVNLSDYLSGNVCIGFSSAAVFSNETHKIFSWSFNSSLHPKNTSMGFRNINSKNTSIGLNRGANGLEITGWKQLSTSTKILLGIGCGICVASALWGYFSFLGRKKAESIGGQMLADMDLDKLLYHIPRRFKLDDLVAGTNNFSETLKLGQGGFGGVYKCSLVETTEIVAVKRISQGSKQGIKEFISEVSIVSRLRHRNLVQLLGWCHEGDQLLLLYEYMPNGSLDRHVFSRGGGEEKRQVLSWSISNFSAKIGDFGLARMVTHERLAQTTLAAGTWGYLAPECVASGKTSPESDVYSFGAVALEIACGKKAIDVNLAEFDMRLVAWAWDLYGRGRLLEAADVRLNGEFGKEEMERLMVVGLWCSHPDAASRPKMRQVLRLLNFEVGAPILPPTMPVPSSIHTSITTGSSLVLNSLPTTLSPR